MPEVETPTEAPPAEAEKKPSLMSMPILMVIGVIMVVEGLLVWMVMGMFGDPTLSAPSFRDNYKQVSMGTFTRELPTDDLRRFKEKFIVDVALVLNPKFGDLDSVLIEVERSKDYLRDIILRELLYRYNAEEFWKPDFLDKFLKDIAQRLNKEWKYEEKGEGMVLRAIYTNIVSRPQRR